MRIPERRSTAVRLLAAVTSVCLLVVGLVVGVVAPAAFAASDISLTATPDASVLAGANAGVTLTASNSTGTNDYNLSFRYQLPTGVSYVAGSTTPATAGEPTVDTVSYVPDPSKPTVTASYQVLVWSNVADLPTGASTSIGFSVTPDPAVYPVGSTFTGSAGAYAQSNPRSIPTFDASGTPNTGSYTTSSTVATTSATTISAIKVTKTQPAPETEVMRGVHQGHGTVYTITVTGTSVAANDGVVVTDYLPAGLEFLGCGGTAVDNSTNPEEYPGSGPLNGALDSSTSCIQPTSIDTVANPAGQAAGVYTVVTWNVGTLAAGATTTISYSAGIPLRENTTSWPNGTPMASSDKQGSNLDNNTGPLTRQVGNGDVFTNTAVATGDYTGPVATGSSSAVSATGSVSTEADDLSLVKTASSSGFTSGSTVNIDLNLRASEYTSDSGMTVTDTVPNGMCPLIPAGFTVTGGSLPADCQTPGTITGGTLESVTANADGSFTLVFAPSDDPLAASGSTDIDYTVLQRSNYQSSSTSPVAAGDAFSAPATVTGTSTVVSATGQTPATETVTDDSKVTFATTPPTISKQILPRTLGITSAADCANPAYASDYVSNDTATSGFPVFQLGDRICFELTVNFSSSTETRNAQITDFVPVGTSYDGYAVSPTSVVPASEVSAPDTSTPNAPTWTIGTSQDGATFVAKGAQLTMFVSAIVSAPATGTTPQITANLMKYTQQSTAGSVYALRDQANYDRAPVPTVALQKGVTAINGTPVSGAPSHNVTVKENDAVSVQLTVSNTGTAAIGNNYSVDGETVWDALPAQLTCSSISAISDSGTCTDAYPGLTGSYAGRSAIVWNLTDVIAPGNTSGPVTYTMTIPSETSVSTVFSNTASVTSFTSPNTAGGDTPYYPTNSLDTALSSSWNTSAANDTATATVPDATVTKTAITPATANDSSSQAVAGEGVSYSYTLTVPAGTTVYNGQLSDKLPTGVSTGPSTTVTADIGGTTGYTPTSVPTGYTLSSTGTLTLPTTLNTGASAQTFTVHYNGLVVTQGEGAWPGSGTLPTAGSIVNTASFASNATLGGTALPARTGSATIGFIVPQPTLQKTVSPSTDLVDGETVTFALSAAEGSTLPPLYDANITDCLPAGLGFVAYGNTPAGVTTDPATPGDGTTCPTGSTQLGWSIGTVVPGAATDVDFTATVDSAAAGGQSYRNTATMTGSTLGDGSNNPATEGVYTVTSNTAVATVAGASISKTVANPTATVGASDQYTVTAVLPADINFYGAAITDSLPAGLTVDPSSATITCTTGQTPQQDCASDLSGDVGGHATPLPSSGSTIGWSLGDVTAVPYTRTIVVSYAGTVDASAASQTINVAGATLTNTAQIGWYANPGSTPANAGSTFDQTGSPSGGAKATITVTEPSLSVSKSVSTTTPQPGSTFQYTVTVSNSAASTSSAAYNVTVTDAVPTGILATLPSTPPAGVTSESISGADPTTGGGTITWTLAGPLAPGASDALGYSATLAPSSTLTTAALTNKASVTAWGSLPGGGRSYPVGTAPSASVSVTPQFPKVTLSKSTPGGQLAYPGVPFQWSFTVANAGPGTAQSVTPTDVLPHNWSYVSGSATVKLGTGAAQQIDPTVTGTGAAQTLVWSGIGPIAAGQSAVVTYEATPSAAATSDPGVGQSSPNVNTVSAVTDDTSGASGDAAGSYTGPNASANAFIDAADLTVVKAVAAPLMAGTSTNSAWTLTVANAAGGDTAVGPFTVSDTPSTLPSGVTITGASGTGWSCTTPDSSGAFQCTRTNASDTLAAGSSFPVIDVATNVAVNVPAGTSVTNAAAVSDKTYDPNPGNNSDSVTSTTTAAADLAITKFLNGSAHAGEPVSWNLAVSNLGPSVSSGAVTVTDPVPAGVTGVTASGVGWDCSASTSTIVSCTMQNLGVQAAPLITVTGSLASSFTGTLSNTATVSGTTTDPVTVDNSSTATTTVATGTTLGIAKTLAAGTDVTAGSNAQYVFTVTNEGPADARNVSVTDPLPDGLTFVAGSTVSQTGNWACSETSQNPSTVTCTLTGTLSAASGSNTAVVEISAHVPSSNTGAVVNTATVHADNASDVSSTQNSTQNLSADLAITKSHPSGPVLAGGSVSYTLDVSDQGPSDATGNTTVTDTLPPGMHAIAASGAQWVCTVSSGGSQVSCFTPATIANGTHAAPITVTATVDADVAPGTLVNEASVLGSIVDPNAANNLADDPTVITTSADVHIAKTVTTGSTVTAGDTAGFDITVTNDGPSNAASVQVQDVAPAGMSIVALSGSGWSCDDGNGSCMIASLAPGTTTIYVTAQVSSAVPDASTLTNAAQLSWVDSAGSHTGSASADVAVAAHADLALTKTAVSGTVAAGANATFRLAVHNNGASDAVGPITVVDTLPAGMTFVGSTGPAWQCTAGPVSASGQTVTCVTDASLGVPANGTAPALAVDVTLDQALPSGQVTNTATVQSPTDDPDPSNNTATATVQVNPLDDLSITKTHSGAVEIGHDLAFHLVVANAGPSAASGVSVTDTLPKGLSYVSTAGSDPAWSCTPATSASSVTTVSCDLTGSVAAAGKAPALTIVTKVGAAAYPRVTNTAHVTSTTPDANPANNTGSDAVAVPAQVDLHIVKTHTGTLQVGKQVTYTITVTNTGSTELPAGYVVTDQLPHGLTFVSAAGHNATCTAHGQTVKCTVNRALPVGGAEHVSVVVEVGSAAYPSIANTASVSTSAQNIGTAPLSARDAALVKAAPADPSDPPASALATTGITGGWRWALLVAALAIMAGLVLLIGRRRRSS